MNVELIVSIYLDRGSTPLGSIQHIDITMFLAVLFRKCSVIQNFFDFLSLGTFYFVQNMGVSFKCDIRVSVSKPLAHREQLNALSE